MLGEGVQDIQAQIRDLADKIDRLDSQLRSIPQRTARLLWDDVARGFPFVMLSVIVFYLAHRAETAAFGKDGAPWYIWAIAVVAWQLAITLWSARSIARRLPPES